MPTIYDIPLHLSEPEMVALQLLLSKLLESDLSHFTDGNEVMARYAKKAAQKAIEAISEFGGAQ